MSKGMLGMLPLSAVQGVINDIQDKLATDEGHSYLVELKKFARKEPCWIPHLIHAVDFTHSTLIDAGWKWDETNTDHNSLTLSEVDFSKILLETCIKEGEQWITGEEKLKRLMASGNIRLDPRFAAALFQEKERKTLEYLHEKHGVTHLDFFGRILVGPLGHRYVVCLSRRDAQGWGWGLGTYWLGTGSHWDRRNFSVGLALVL